MTLYSDETLLKNWNKHKEISEGELGPQHKNARESHAFYSGDQSFYVASTQDKGVRNTVVFNKVAPFIDAVSGFAIQLRRQPDYQARIMGREEQEAYSSFMNSLSSYARGNANLDSLESQQTREMLIAGYAAIDTNVSYEMNPDGEIVAEIVKYDDIFWDPQAKEKNLLDGRWVYRRKAYSMDEALERFEGSEPEDFESYTGDREDAFIYNPAGGEYDKIAAGAYKDEDLVQVYYYQYWKLEDYYRAENPLLNEPINPATASVIAQLLVNVQENRAEVTNNETDVEDIFEFDPFAEYLTMNRLVMKDVREVYKRFGIELETQMYKKRVYYTAIVSGTTVFQHFKSPDQQGFTIKFKTGKYDVVNKQWYAIVAGLKEPARYANKSLSEILYAIASNSKGGVMYEESAVEDPRRFEQQYATTKAAIQVRDGAISGNKITSKATAALPTGYENVYQISNQSMEEVSGIGREFLGTSANSQVSALLESQRIDRVIATLADYFDSISLYQKEHARLMQTFLKTLAENSQGRLFAVTGQSGIQTYEQLTLDRFADEYDVDIGEAPSNAQQKSETAKVVLDMADKMAAMGRDIYPLVIDYIPGLKQSDKVRIKDSMEPDPQQVQAQQQQAQEAAEAQRAVTQSLVAVQESQAIKNIADAELRRQQGEKAVAETVRTLEDAQQIAIETDVVKNMPVEEVTVNL